MGTNIFIGLTKDEVRYRIKKNLVNYNSDISTKKVSEILINNIFTLFNMLNLFIALIIFFVGSFKNLLFMGIVVCNTVISIIQELNSKRIIDQLSILTQRQATVVRDGIEKVIHINEIVLNDIIKYHNGKQVVVDSVIKDGIVEVDESFITGESNNILKKVGDTLLSGSFIVSGKCICEVVAIGDDNYSAKISKEAKYVKDNNSIIMNTLKMIIKWLSIVIIPLGIILFLRQLGLSGNDIRMSVLNTSAAILSMIPEGLVLLVSTVLAVSVVRLGKRKVLVQDLYCTESLARIDTLCLDKTGTITEGNLEVKKVVSFTNDDIDVILSEFSYVLKEDNKTMQAIYDKFYHQHSFKVVHTIPFSSQRKYSLVSFDNGTYVIGAPDKLLDKKYHKYLDEYSDYRVLALMYSKDIIRDYSLPYKMKAIGLIILQDKIRQGVKDTLDYLNNQDISLKIISGDSSKTVFGIAKEVGINPKLIDMSKISDTDNLIEIVEKYNVFVRVLPEQKRDIISSLKINNHSVGMIGDGVNDCLALKEADSSISFKNGADAARNTSQIILLDNDFNAIPEIIKEGRKTINNIERSSALFLTKTIYAILLSILFLFVSVNYPFQPIQLSLTSAITIGIPSFLLALESNNNRIKGHYLINVLSKSIPAALTIVVNVIFVLILSLVVKISDAEISTMSVVLVAFTGFLLLFKLCLPFNFKRIILFIGLIAVFMLLVIGLNDFFELVTLSFPKFIFIGIICLLDIVFFTNLGLICEKKIFNQN